MFAPMALNARAGVRSVAIEQIHAAYSIGALAPQIIRHVILPAALPEILTGMRIGIGFGWTTLVAAEMVAATAGLGYMVLYGGRVPAHRRRDHGHRGHRRARLSVRPRMRWLERTLVPWKGKV